MTDRTLSSGARSPKESVLGAAPKKRPLGPVAVDPRCSLQCPYAAHLMPARQATIHDFGRFFISVGKTLGAWNRVVVPNWSPRRRRSSAHGPGLARPGSR